MLGFLLKKWSNVICSDITVRKEQDTGARGRFARSAGSCMGMSHPLSLAFFSSHPGKKVLYIYGSVFFPSDIWTQSISTQSLIYQSARTACFWTWSGAVLISHQQLLQIVLNVFATISWFFFRLYSQETHLPLPLPHADCFIEMEQQDVSERSGHTRMPPTRHPKPWPGLRGEANPHGPPTHLSPLGHIPRYSCGCLPPSGPAADLVLHSFVQEVLLEIDGIKCYLNLIFG